jgi:alpha,alpha-trehalase
VFPLFAKIATSEQAAAVAKRIEQDFLKKGGLITTLEHNGQQWDAPNGWAPLQYVAIMGLREYGYDGLANEIRDRWLKLNDKVFAAKRKMVEKYDVESADIGGGGEYPLQDGFGWTNGVYAALYDERERSNGK